MLYNDVLGTVGNTPMVRLNRIVPKSAAEVYVKLESFNPSGSVKDRSAISMIRDAEAKGLLKRGYSIVEPTSGNTGIGLAMAAAVLGYKAIFVIPDSVSPDRIPLIRAFGAEVITTPGSDGLSGAVRKAEKIVASGDAFMPQQFNNNANVMAHYVGTAKEILQDVPDVSTVIAGVGTGGTVTGIGMGMRNFSPGVKVIGVEPFESPMITKGVSGSHEIPGTGANFVPENLDMKYVDQIVTVKGEDAKKVARRLAREEGILVGISSGATVAVAMELAERYDRRKKIVAIAGDCGERYIGSGIYE